MTVPRLIALALFPVRWAHNAEANRADVQERAAALSLYPSASRDVLAVPSHNEGSPDHR